MRGGLDPRVIGQPEIVVGREHHDLVAAYHHVATLLAFQRHFVFEGLCLFDVFKLAIKR
jgi:hypothetical protein